MSFTDLLLDPELVQGLAELKLTSATDIQKQAIPAILEGGDLLASAPTGAGKTLAFVLPALQHLLDSEEEPVDSARVLILSPTRELALQTHNIIEKAASLTNIRSALFVGGTPYGNQQKALEDGVDILVATPGRLLELYEREWVDLSLISCFVIDEADRMLDMGFIDAILGIEKRLPKSRQTLMFSATLEHSTLSRVASEVLNEGAQKLELAPPRGVPEHIKQSVFFIDNDDHKKAVLDVLIMRKEIKQAIVFVASRKQVDDWVKFMHARKIYCYGLHGDLKQGERTDKLKQMRRGRIKVLVATDIAARGLDLLDISHVINVNLPMKGDSYVHRAGRCGRTGQPGQVWSLVDTKDFPNLGRIERYMQTKIRRETVAGLAPKKGEPKVLKKTKVKKKVSGVKGKAKAKPANKSAKKPSKR